MIIQRNYSPSALPKGTDPAELTSRIIGPLTLLIERSGIDQDNALGLRVHLEWIQYKTSFRDPVVVRRAVDQQEQPLPLSEIAIDLRQADLTDDYHFHTDPISHVCRRRMDRRRLG